MILSQAWYVACNKKHFIETVNSCTVCNTTAILLLTRPILKYKVETKWVFTKWENIENYLNVGFKHMFVTSEHIKHAYRFAIYIICLLKMLTHIPSVRSQDKSWVYVCVSEKKKQAYFSVSLKLHGSKKTKYHLCSSFLFEKLKNSW